MSSIPTFSVILILAGTALANAHVSCTTQYGNHRVRNVQTKYHKTTSTITPTFFVTSARKTTVTPSPVTLTIVSTETDTTTSTIETTDTFTSTITQSTTTTTTLPTATVTATETTSTTTTSTSTSTIGTAAGYTPIQSSLPGATYHGARSGPVSKRSIDSNAERAHEIEERASTSTSSKLSSKPKSDCLRPQKYPQCVECTTTVTKRAPAVTSTRTGKIRTMTASTSTITTTSFATTTVTATSVNDASTTITTTTTETATATASPSTTTTTTSTTTVTQMATATGYAQCAANNFADKLNGNNIYLQAASSGNYGVKNIAGVTNALDCCVACATTTDCSVSIYTVQEGGCYLLTNCGTTFPTVQDNSYDWIVNNGCGKAVSS